MGALPAHMFVYLMCAYFSQRPEDDIKSLRTGVVDSSEKPCGFWASNPDPLRGQPVVLINGFTFLAHIVIILELSTSVCIFV